MKFKGVILIKENNMNEENLYLLCTAVLKQAIKDLESAYRYNNRDLIETLEKFILCEDGNPIPSILYGDSETGKYIIKKVRNKLYGKNNKRTTERT